MSDDKYTKDALSSLASTVVDKAPYFGSLPLPADAFKIYFDNKNGEAQYVWSLVLNDYCLCRVALSIRQTRRASS